MTVRQAYTIKLEVFPGAVAKWEGRGPQNLFSDGSNPSPRLHPSKTSQSGSKCDAVFRVTSYSLRSILRDLERNARKNPTDPKQSHPPRSYFSLFPDTGAAPVARMERNSFGASLGNGIDRFRRDHSFDVGYGY